MSPDFITVKLGSTANLIQHGKSVLILPAHALAQLDYPLRDAYEDFTSQPSPGIFTNALSITPSWPSSRFTFFAVDAVKNHHKAIVVSPEDACQCGRTIVAVPTNTLRMSADMSPNQLSGSIIYRPGMSNEPKPHLSRMAHRTAVAADLVQFYINGRDWNRKVFPVADRYDISLSVYEECITTLDNQLMAVDELMRKYPTRLMSVDRSGSSIVINIHCDYRVYLWTREQENKLED